MTLPEDFKDALKQKINAHFDNEKTVALKAIETRAKQLEIQLDQIVANEKIQDGELQERRMHDTYTKDIQWIRHKISWLRTEWKENAVAHIEKLRNELLNALVGGHLAEKQKKFVEYVEIVFPFFLEFSENKAFAEGEQQRLIRNDFKGSTNLSITKRKISETKNEDEITQLYDKLQKHITTRGLDVVLQILTEAEKSPSLVPTKKLHDINLNKAKQMINSTLLRLLMTIKRIRKISENMDVMKSNLPDIKTLYKSFLDHMNELAEQKRALKKTDKSLNELAGKSSFEEKFKEIVDDKKVFDNLIKLIHKQWSPPLVTHKFAILHSSTGELLALDDFSKLYIKMQKITDGITTLENSFMKWKEQIDIFLDELKSSNPSLANDISDLKKSVYADGDNMLLAYGATKQYCSHSGFAKIFEASKAIGTDINKDSIQELIDKMFVENIFKPYTSSYLVIRTKLHHLIKKLT